MLLNRNSIRFFLIAFAALLLGQHEIAAVPTEGRALWVTRWDYSSADDIRKIVQNAASSNFNIIMFQVRGEATVFYPSQYEPWAWELTGKNPSTCGQSPGWDPLATAIAYAHAAKIELHAYMNVLPAWKQATPPPASINHIFTSHKNWLMYDKQGYPMPVTSEIYSFLNPAHPDVKRHLIALFGEVTRKYAIDGIHFDYVRYPSEYKNADLSYDKVSLAMFKKETQSTPDTQPDAWRKFKTEQINDLMKRLYVTVKSQKPNVMLSAACIANREDALEVQCQDSLAWLNGGYMDCIMPMNYTEKSELFLERSAPFLQQRKRGLIYMGIQANRGSQAFKDQISYLRKMRMHGIGVFAYENLFPDHRPNDLARMLKNEIFETPARVTGRKYVN